MLLHPSVAHMEEVIDEMNSDAIQVHPTKYHSSANYMVEVIDAMSWDVILAQ